MIDKRITRRGFVQDVCTAAAAPYVIASAALGSAEKPLASERIVIDQANRYTARAMREPWRL